MLNAFHLFSVLGQVPSDPLAALDLNVQDSLIKQIARDLVAKVLSAASSYVDKYISWRDGQQTQRLTDVHYNENFKENCTEQDMAELAIPSDSNESDDDLNEFIDEESVLRKLARKLVRKVLHSACTLLEPLNRASSIEELVTLTKKLKLTVSPSGTPPVIIEEECQLLNNPLTSKSLDGALLDVSNRLSDQATLPNSPSFSVGSRATLLHASDPRDNNLGKKRQRSASHEANMEKDLEGIRLKFQTKLHVSANNPGMKPASDDQEKSASEESLSVPFRNSRSLGAMVSDIRKMSIMEVEEKESESGESSDEENYTVLDAVTKPAQDIESNRNLDSGTVLQNQSSSFKNMQTNDVHLCNNSSHITFKPEVYLSQTTVHNAVVPDLEYYIIIHSFPPSGECQKFLCSNQDEVNLLFHCWLFKDMPLDATISVTEQVRMGLFEPQGVSPVHLDLVDGGIPFFHMDSRSAS